MDLDRFYEIYEFFKKVGTTHNMWSFMETMRYCMDNEHTEPDGWVSLLEMDLKNVDYSNKECEKHGLVCGRREQSLYNHKGTAVTFTDIYYAFTLKGLWYLYLKDSVDEFFFALPLDQQDQVLEWIGIKKY